MSPSEALDILLSFSDAVFWGSNHQRDILYTIRDRWAEFSQQERARLEQRLLTTTYPWSDSTRGGKARAEAHERLDRLHWLHSQGVDFSFDMEIATAELRPIADGWSERSGEEAADSHAPVVRSIDTDLDPSSLQGVPIGEVLELARKAEQTDFFAFVERRPFNGLAEQKPARALAALTNAARKGSVPAPFWAAFLLAEKRKTDPARLVYAIGGRIASLPPKALSAITYPVAEWLEGLGERLFGEFSSMLERLWEPLLAALPLREDDRDHQVDSSWANDALNSPVGKLTRLLIKDPSAQGCVAGGGFPKHWTHRHEQLLALPRDMRRHALVMLGFQINWLFYIAPDWTSANLLKVVDDQSEDADALWDGILWAARSPSPALYDRLKRGLLARAVSPARRRAEANVIGGFLLIGWGSPADAHPSEQLVTSVELRQILVESDNDLRRQVLKHLEHWSADREGQWYARLVPFLTDVWPNHRALRTPEISTFLVDLALASADQFPDVVRVVLPRLVPLRGGMLRGLMLRSDTESQTAQTYPAAMLDLLWAILAEDVKLWPYKVEDVLARLIHGNDGLSACAGG